MSNCAKCNGHSLLSCSLFFFIKKTILVGQDWSFKGQRTISFGRKTLLQWKLFQQRVHGPTETLQGQPTLGSVVKDPEVQMLREEFQSNPKELTENLFAEKSAVLRFSAFNRASHFVTGEEGVRSAERAG